MKKIIFISVLILALSLPMLAGGKRVSGSRTFMTGTNIASSSANSQMNNDAASKKSLLWTDKGTSYTTGYQITSSPVIVDKVINSPEPINPVLPIVPPVVQPVIEQVRGQKASSNSPYVYGLPTENTADNATIPVPTIKTKKQKKAKPKGPAGLIAQDEYIGVTRTRLTDITDLTIKQTIIKEATGSINTSVRNKAMRN